MSDADADAALALAIDKAAVAPWFKKISLMQ